MLRLEQGPNSFKLFFHDHLFFHHEPNRPAFSAGIGTGKYKMRHGSFKITEKVHEHIPLLEFTVPHQDARQAVVVFNRRLTVAFRADGDNLVIDFDCSRTDVNRFWMSIVADPGEHIYGCGEQFSELDLRGRKVPIWCEEQGIGRGHDFISLLCKIPHVAGNWATTYFAQPTFVSSANYFCHVGTTAYARFDFTHPRFHQLYLWDRPTRVVLGKRETAPDTVKAVGDYLGRQPALPDWVHDGVWLGIQGGTAVVREKLQKALDAGVRVTALWCQDWEGIRLTAFGQQLMWNWRYDEERYPDLPAFIEELEAEHGIKFLGYINPMLAPEKEQFREAAERGYLVKDADGEDYMFKVTTFPVGAVDLSNPEAFAWIKQTIKENMLGVGLAGWMADYAEYFPVDAKVHSGEPGETFHNQYPVLWARANMEAIQEAGKQGEAVFFSRSGYTGSSRHTQLIWAGDQLVNWSFDDGFATVIPAGVSLGFCGIGFHHSDIGGFTTVFWIKRTKELFMRWAEQACFTVVMRTHEGNNPPKNVHYHEDAEILAHFAKMSHVHVHLKPYIKHTIQEYLTEGLPCMRHPYIHYEGDDALHELKYQYLFGRDLLVAPVVKKGRTKRSVYLPADEWYHLWTGKEYTGGWHEVPAPLGEPPVFYRGNSAHRALFEGVREVRVPGTKDAASETQASPNPPGSTDSPETSDTPDTPDSKEPTCEQCGKPIAEPHASPVIHDRVDRVLPGDPSHFKHIHVTYWFCSETCKKAYLDENDGAFPRAVREEKEKKE